MTDRTDQNPNVEQATAEIAAVLEPVRTENAELRDMLRAVREALDIPHAATVGHDETRSEILQKRIMHATTTLASVLDDSWADVVWSTAYLREQLAKCPATGYVTNDQAHAALDQGKNWTEAITLPAPVDGKVTR